MLSNFITYRSALRTPDHSAPVTGGINRNEPIGGDAYGMPLNASTGSKCLPSKCTITPDTGPYFVVTTRDDNCTVSAPMPPKLFILLLLLLLLLLAAAFDVPLLAPLLLLITLFILLILLLLLLPLLNAVEISRRNISIIIMNVFSFWLDLLRFYFLHKHIDNKPNSISFESHLTSLQHDVWENKMGAFFSLSPNWMFFPQRSEADLQYTVQFTLFTTARTSFVSLVQLCLFFSLFRRKKISIYFILFVIMWNFCCCCCYCIRSGLLFRFLYSIRFNIFCCRRCCCCSTTSLKSWSRAPMQYVL